MAADRLRPWIAHGAFSLILFLITAATYSSLGVVLPAMVKDLGWSWSEAGLGFTLMGAATGASSWFPAALIRKFGLRTTLAAGSAVMVAGLAGFAHAESIAAYLIGAVLCGVGFQMMALIPGTHALAILFERKALAFGLYFTIGSLGRVVGPLMAEHLAGPGGQDWRGYWLIQAGLAAVAGLAGVLAVGRVRQAPTVSGAKAAPVAPAPRVDFTVAQAVRTPQFYVLLAAYFTHLLAVSVAASISVAHLTEKGVAAATAGLLLSLEGLITTLSRLGGGLIADRVSAKLLLVVGQAALAIGCVALGHGQGFPAQMLYAFGIGLGFGLTVLAVTLLLLEYFGPRNNLEIFALTCLVGAVSAVGSLVAGVVRDHLGGFAPALYGMGGLIALVAVACALMRPPAASPKRSG
jgi:MFS family permease